MKTSSSALIVLFILSLSTVISTNIATAVLQPSRFDIARYEDAKISLSCGEGFQKNNISCKIGGSKKKVGSCTWCGAVKNHQQHNIDLATDGKHNTRWRSQAKLEGSELQKLNITLIFRQSFELDRLVITTAESPLPAIWTIEISRDRGTTFEPWRYFAPSLRDCLLHFGQAASQINCITTTKEEHHTNQQLRLVASGVRLRFLQIQANHTQNFYSIRQLSLRGRCLCNGHAEICNASRKGVIQCSCKHNTCGVNCEKCCFGFQRTEGSDSPCVSTNSHNILMRDEANRKPRLCYCNRFATIGLRCNPPTRGGPCRCKTKFRGRRCDRCAPGYYLFPLCFPCSCNPKGSVDQYCDSRTGQCTCKGQKRGRTCSKCPKSQYNFPSCTWCGCNPLSVTSDVCDDSGQCICKKNYEGHLCGECKPGYFAFPFCTRCACSLAGSVGVCNSATGQCVCKNEYSGSICNSCKDGYYGYPQCKKCNCNELGSTNSLCDKKSGRCICNEGVQGLRCDQCEAGKNGFPKCRKCACNAAGTKPPSSKSTGACYTVNGKVQCLCKSHVKGHSCDACSYGYYNLSARNPQGCSSCRCNYLGTVSGSLACHTHSGKCECKKHVTGLRCLNCKDGYYGMKLNDVFGCQACQCNPGASLNSTCEVQSGHCSCKPWIAGKNCNFLTSSLPKYIPTLHHIRAELENSLTHDRQQVSVGASVSEFPSFSGAGYMYGLLGQSFFISITIPRTSRYRLVFNYVLARTSPTVATIRLISSDGRSRLNLQATFVSTKVGSGIVSRLMTVRSNRPRPYEVRLTAGQWKISMTTRTVLLLLDYVSFVPEEYFKPSILRENPTFPCEVHSGKVAIHCDMYVYYNLSDTTFVQVKGQDAYVVRGGGIGFKLELYQNFNLRPQDIAYLGKMALLGERQTTLYFDIIVKSKGPHNLLVEYFHYSLSVFRNYVIVAGDQGVLTVQPCRFTFGCRQVVSTGNAVKSFNFKKSRNRVRLLGSSVAKIGIISITAIPANKWNSEYLKPSLLCRWFAGSCIMTTYYNPRGTFKLTEWGRVKPKKQLQGDDSGAQNIVKLAGRVRPNNYYYIAIHYKQAKDLSIDAELTMTLSSKPVTISRQFAFCPADAGCRVLLGEGKGRAFFVNIQRPTIEIKTASPFTVEYFLLIPSLSYTPRVTLLQSGEKPAEFINKCAKNHLKVGGNPSRFCLSSVFTLTTHFNQGPLSCRCNPEGSNSAYCQQYGGQCACAAYVVGRKCDRCAIGYSGFPYCERCLCNQKGSITRYCDPIGNCKCKRGYGGRLCDRCLSAVYYGFPKCRPCGCNLRGSLGLFCRSRDGQCQCLRNFSGLKCDRCRIGFSNYPQCKECSCKAEGIKTISGLTDTCGKKPGSNKCLCKDNVQGQECDQCKDLFFNLQMRNPDGCQPCLCFASGTVGEQRMCHKETGQCTCKAHVMGRRCDECQQGYINLVATDLFGCKRCTCNPGGAYEAFCDSFTDQCNCRPNIAGDQCNRVASGQFFYPDLHHIKFEFEDGQKQDGSPVSFRHRESEFPKFSWKGYIGLKGDQTSMKMLIDVPQARNYRVIIRYRLSQTFSVTAVIRFIPTKDSDALPGGAAAATRILQTLFQSTASWFFTLPDFNVVKDKSGKPSQVFLSRGNWTLVINAPSSNILLDYLVLLPEDYYKQGVLKDHVLNPCEVNSSSKFCLHYSYKEVTAHQGKVMVQAETGTPRSVIKISNPFVGVLLNEIRKTLTLSLPRTLNGTYVLQIKYYHDSSERRLLNIVVKTGRTTERAIMPLLSCRFTFGCRQIALDNQHKMKKFSFFSNRAASVSFIAKRAVALDYLAAIPVSVWDSEYLVPAQQCIKHGANCISASFSIPSGSVVVQAENRTTAGPEVRKPPYLLDLSIKLEYIVPGQKILYIRGTVPSGRYLLVVHYFQPDFLSFEGKVIVTSGHIATSAKVDYRYCPYVSGCRALGHRQQGGRKKYFFIGIQSETLFSVVIPEDKSLWIDYVMLVNSRSFSQAILEADPVDLTNVFVLECASQHYHIKPTAPAFCIDSVFALTTRLNNGALPCNCNKLGSTSSTCQSYGGQCQCRPNVIGRTCNKCKSGFTNFPNC